MYRDYQVIGWPGFIGLFVGEGDPLLGVNDFNRSCSRVVTKVAVDKPSGTPMFAHNCISLAVVFAVRFTVQVLL